MVPWGIIAQAGGNLVNDISQQAGDYYAQSRYRSALDKQRAGLEEAGRIGQEYYGQAEKAYMPEYQNLASDYEAYRKQMQGAPVEMGNYDPASAQKWLDPYADFSRQQQLADLEQSAAMQGGLMSGPTAKELLKTSNAFAQQNWNQAQQMSYNDFVNKYDSALKAQQMRNQNLQNLYSASNAGREGVLGALGNKAQLGMQTAQGVGDINAQGDIARGQYLQNTFNRFGMHNKTAGDAMGSMFGGGGNVFGGGGAK